MTGKEYLSGIKLINIKIQRKERQIEMLKQMATDITQTLNDMPKADSKDSSPMANMIIKIIDLENEVRELKGILEGKKTEALSYIFRLENDEYQTVLILRYLHFMSWESISNAMHYTKRWLYKMHGTALLLFSAIFDK
ncbi:MAG: hypothetical protein IJT23_07105 [Clostridia bacterium]|nr:hypothetical protein [Clostridia bacterium]